jgi:ATP-grasp domain, R2K clade family 3
VNARVAEWQPHEAFVIDVCETSDGLRIVEINTLNAAGFYAGDVQKLALCLEESFTR